MSEAAGSTTASIVDAEPAVAVPHDLGLAAEGPHRLDDVGLAVRAREEHDPDGHAVVSRLTDRVLDDRVGQEPRAEVVDFPRAAPSSAASRSKRIALPTVTLAHGLEAEHRQRPLDGGALGVGDARPQPHLDEHREPHRAHCGTGRRVIRASPRSAGR